MTSSLVGSEMCIRDSLLPWPESVDDNAVRARAMQVCREVLGRWTARGSVSYTHLTLPTICSV
eukprot:8355211-Prorocentrum_lima.AAC.1